MEEDEKKLLEIFKLTERLFSTITHHEIVDAILQKAIAIFNCRVCLISIQKGKLVIENGLPFYGYGIGEIISPKRGEKFLRGIIDGGHTVIINDPINDKRFDYLRLLIERYRISSVIFSPLRCAKGEDLGILIFDALEERKFRKEDVKFAKAISHVAVLAMQREIREQKEKTKMLRDERMVTLGKHSAAVAHSIRNILTPVRIAASLMTETISSGATSQKKRKEVKEYAELVSSNVAKLENVVKNILDFSKPNVYLEKCRLNILLAEEIKKLRFTYSNLAFKVDLDNRLSLVSFMIDKYRFLICLDDLVRNAVEAGATKVLIRSKLSKLECVISIVDNGEGIDPQIIDDIFMPSMTTKCNGTGLGLAIVASIVENHNGRVAVKSEKGRTEFKIFLPLSSSTQK